MGAVAILQLVSVAEPLAFSIAKDIAALCKKYPALTPEQVTTALAELAVAVHATNADTQAKIAADMAAHGEKQ